MALGADGCGTEPAGINGELSASFGLSARLTVTFGCLWLYPPSARSKTPPQPPVSSTIKGAETGETGETDAGRAPDYV
jgi:hypothetical protein